MKTNPAVHHGRGVEAFLAAHAADVTGGIGGFDRLRLRASLRCLYQPGFMKRYLCEARVLPKDFGGYATALSNRIRAAAHAFYFQHAEFGLMHLRVQSWFPFQGTVCLNGRLWLARQLDRAGLGYVQRDNGEFPRRYLQHVLTGGPRPRALLRLDAPAAKARRRGVDTLLAVVIVVRPRVHAPSPWHLRCPCCGTFTLVRLCSLARAPR